MIIERIIFNVLAFGFFVIVFLKMIKKNDSNYIYVLATQALGIAIGFIGLIFRINLPVVVIILTYIISILAPIAIILLERKGLYLSEIIYLNIAKHYYKKNNNEKAKQALMKGTDKFLNSYLLHKELALVCEKMGEKQIAVDEYLRSSEINISDYDLKIKTANALNSADRSKEAEIILYDLLRKQPENLDAAISLGNILYEKENYKEAINVYLQSLNYNPNEYDLYYNLGMIFTLLNDFQTAKEYYEKAAQLNSLLFHAKYNLGQIALLYNELDEAENYFTECINEEDIVDEVYYYLSYVSILKGDKESAIQYLNTAVEDNIELYEKACKENVFKLIINKIKKPSNTAKQRKKVTQKEKQAMKHLEKTCEVVGNLNQNDIKAIRHLREKEKKQQRQEQEELLRKKQEEEMLKNRQEEMKNKGE